MIPSFTDRIKICHRCPNRQDPCHGPCPCLSDGRDIIDHAKAGDCPLGRYTAGANTGPSAVAPLPDASTAWITTHGRELWAELHDRPDADAAYIADFIRRIPCGECRGHWLQILAEHPPRFGDEWFDWTVQVHNAVNAHLGKPQTTPAEARIDRASRLIERPSTAV